MDYRRVVQRLQRDVTWWIPIPGNVPHEGWNLTGLIRVWLKRHNLPAMAYFDPPNVAVITSLRSVITRYDKVRWSDDHSAQRELLDVFEVKFNR